jgi:hypothetical protein
MARYFVAYFNTSNGRWEGVNANDADQAFDAGSGTAANALAYQLTARPGKYSSFPIDGAATAVLSIGTGNAGIDYTAKGSGTLGNQLTVRYVVSGNNTPLSVSVTGRDITVNLATSAGGAATSTAIQVRDAVNAHAVASTLVTAVLSSGSDGSGIPGAQTALTLAGGTSGGATVEDLQPSTAPVTTPSTW